MVRPAVGSAGLVVVTQKSLYPFDDRIGKSPGAEGRPVLPRPGDRQRVSPRLLGLSFSTPCVLQSEPQVILGMYHNQAAGERGTRAHHHVLTPILGVVVACVRHA